MVCDWAAPLRRHEGARLNYLLAALATSLAGIVAAATAFHAPATPTIISQYEPAIIASDLNPDGAGSTASGPNAGPDAPSTYTVRGLAYDGTPEPATIAPTAAETSTVPDRDVTCDLCRVNPASRHGDGQATAAAATAIDIPALICSYAWDCTTALRIATCESGLQPWATNGRFKGLFQLDTYNGGWFAHFGYDAADWADPATNVQVAYLLYASSGFSPWSCK